jgi:hypothetical protein
LSTESRLLVSVIPAEAGIQAVLNLNQNEPGCRREFILRASKDRHDKLSLRLKARDFNHRPRETLTVRIEPPRVGSILATGEDTDERNAIARSDRMIVMQPPEPPLLCCLHT